MVKFRVIVRFLAYLCIPSLLPVAESDDTVDCSTDSRGFDDDIFTVTCPAGCTTASTIVWGTGVYTDDSSICRAAIHDGRITDTGGQVTVYRWPGQDSYQASKLNGIQTIEYGSWDDSFAFAPVCQHKLGMEDGAIEDGDITASTSDGGWSPLYARLNGDYAWFPSVFNGSWLQVDLKQQKTISGVITQGYDGRRNYWVKRYQVRYLKSNGTWAPIMSHTGNTMTFSGNTGPNGQKTNMFYRPIVTQKIRLYPTSWKIAPGLRMELLGCDFIASTTQSTTFIRTTSNTQSTNFIRTTSTLQSTTPTLTSPQTVGSFSTVALATTALYDGAGEQEQQQNPSGSLGVGAIVGIAAGVAVVLIAILVSMIIFLRKRQANNAGTSNVPKDPPEQRFRNPEYSDVTATNEHTAPAQDEGYTDCELYNTEDSNPYEPYNYANSGQISGGEISQSSDNDYATIPGESDRGVVDNVIYETSDMT